MNGRYKGSSGVCVEVEGVIMEISKKKSENSKKKMQQYEVPPDAAAGCWLALQVFTLMIRVSFNRQLLYCRECS